MSHSVTVTRTTTTTTTSALIINTGYLKTWPGILKLLQLLLGIVNVGIVGYYIHPALVEKHYFFLIATTFMIGTFLLLFSCLISIATASIISKTVYEVVYHTVAFLLYITASLTLLVEIRNYSKRSASYEPLIAAGVMGLIASILYLLSAYFARRSYRGI